MPSVFNLSAKLRSFQFALRTRQSPAGHCGDPGVTENPFLVETRRSSLRTDRRKNGGSAMKKFVGTLAAALLLSLGGTALAAGACEAPECHQLARISSKTRRIQKGIERTRGCARPLQQAHQARKVPIRSVKSAPFACVPKTGGILPRPSRLREGSVGFLLAFSDRPPMRRGPTQVLRFHALVWRTPPATWCPFAARSSTA